MARFEKYLSRLHKNNRKEFERLTIVGHKRKFNKINKSNGN